jgi:AAA+ ATPase superfamily predicted ATPase
MHAPRSKQSTAIYKIVRENYRKVFFGTRHKKCQIITNKVKPKEKHAKSGKTVTGVCSCDISRIKLSKVKILCQIGFKVWQRIFLCYNNPLPNRFSCLVEDFNMSFLGRKNEVELLTEQFTKKDATMIAMLGRRRIGKSTLIKHAASINHLPIFEFQGLAPRPGITNQDQLKHFSGTLASFLGIKSLAFDDWGQALGMLAQLPFKKRGLIFLDEISWMGEKDSDFAGKLKEQWDTKLSQNKNIVLVICGSVSSWIQRNILTGTGFSGRVSLEINLQELSISESCQLLREKKKVITINEIAKFLSLTGGVPRYLEEMNTKETAEDNIKLRCFNSSGFLFSEFDKIFAEVFGKRHKMYREILMKLQDKNAKSFGAVIESSA